MSILHPRRETGGHRASEVNNEMRNIDLKIYLKNCHTTKFGCIKGSSNLSLKLPYQSLSGPDLL
jgi:hypothetical protein